MPNIYKNNRAIRLRAAAALLTVCLFTAGCRSAEQRALDQAKSQAAATSTAQQIQYIDANGDTVTTTVQPPLAGQPQQVATTITPAPAGPKPHRTRPVVIPLGANGAALAMSGPAAVPAPGPDAPQQPYAGQPMNESAAASPNSSVPPGAAIAGGAPVQPGAPAPNTAAPAFNLTVPSGTELAVRVNQRIDVKHAVAGERFTGEIVQPVTQNGSVVIPRGTPVRGRIDAAHRRGHFKGRSVLELRLVSITLNGNEYGLDTHDTVRTKKGKGKRSAGLIGGLTGAGMLIGGIASGGVGLAIGGASGAGAGTLLAGATGNRDIVIPAESIVHFRLSDDLVVQNP
ncbi:MAG TPA: hypothetical protein VM865_05660 [Acidobacteriaceae bacterium]|jgi:hypothetical protein|nr:hypothetical protein [Acidobacteriaceae bacterium]